MGWNAFFHSRCGARGMKLVGWLRMFYAALVIVDRICLGFDFDFLFSPTHGVLNYHIGQQNPNAQVPGLWSLFAWAPDSPELLWGLHYLGLLQAILLFLGVAPKFQLICLYVNLISFQHHNFMLWDGEDRMFKLWAFMFLFFPLHTVTIFDSFGKNMNQNETWPMWPVRIFQLEMTLIYMGASFSKMNSQSWVDGTAMYWISYTKDYYPGVFNPDVLFNRLFPLQVLCWSAILLETAGWTLVWIPSFRAATIVGMFALHLGIEYSMNMYAFEWLAMIGWSVFLVQPNTTVVPMQVVSDSHTKGKNDVSVVPPYSSAQRRSIGNVFVIAILSLFAIESVPLEDMYELAPNRFQPLVAQLGEYQEFLYEYVEIPLHFLGLHQGVWNMYAGEYPDSSNCYYRANLHYHNGTTTYWNSPDWIHLPWWERKMKMRLMNYYDSAETSEAAASWVAFAKQLQQQHSTSSTSSTDDNASSLVTTVDLYLRCEFGIDYPENIGWFEPIRQPMEENLSLLVTVDICSDDYPECKDWMENGLCSDHTMWMQLYCQQSCGMCEDYIVTWPSIEHAEHTIRTGYEIFADMYDQYAPPDVGRRDDDDGDDDDDEEEEE